MSAVLPTDKTLVNRAGVDHSAPADMSTVQDTDLLLINRAGVDYKCTFADWKNSQGKPPSVGAVTLADVAGGARFTSVAFPVSATMTDDGTPTSTKGLKAWVEGSLMITPETSTITNVNTLAPATTYDKRTSLQGYGSTPTAWSGGSNNVSNVSIGTPAGGNPSEPGILFQFPAPGFVRINTNTSSDSNVRINLWSSPDGITWSGPQSILQGQISTGRPEYNPSIGFRAKYGCIQREGGTNGIYWYPTSSSAITTLTLTDNTDLAYFQPGDVVQTGGVSIAAIDSAALSISIIGGSWSGSDGTSSGTVADRETTVKGVPRPGANVKLFCKLDAAGAVSDLQSVDPGFTAWTPAGTGPYTGTVTFPATLPTGNAPDADLPAGTTITVEVEASNTAGADSAKSNTVTPS